MAAARIAYLCALLSILVVHSSWLWAVNSGHVQWCNPYWTLCHSISATGRQYPEALLFKGGMLMVSNLMLAYWWLLRHWLMRLRCHRGLSFVIVLLGIISSLALILYTLTLGSEPYALIRRMGIIVFFAFSGFAHLLLINALSERVGQSIKLAAGLINLTLLCLLLILLGLASGITGYFWSGYADWENAFEWWFALLLTGQFILVGRMWVQTNYQVVFSLERDDTA